MIAPHVPPRPEVAARERYLCARADWLDDRAHVGLRRRQRDRSAWRGCSGGHGQSIREYFSAALYFAQPGAPAPPGMVLGLDDMQNARPHGADPGHGYAWNEWLKVRADSSAPLAAAPASSSSPAKHWPTPPAGSMLDRIARAFYEDRRAARIEWAIKRCMRGSERMRARLLARRARRRAAGAQLVDQVAAQTVEQLEQLAAQTEADELAAEQAYLDEIDAADAREYATGPTFDGIDANIVAIGWPGDDA